jgi:hypothetical protein
MAMAKTAGLVVVASLLLFSSFASADDWSGSIGIAAAARSVSGSDASFRSQTNVRSGVSLDGLTLTRDRLTLTASGFGNAEPSESARIVYRFRTPLTLTVAYDRRDSFFNVSDSLRADDWNIARYSARAVWDGWQAGAVTLDLRQLQRGGSAIRPYYALGEIYPVRLRLRDVQREATVRFDTRGYPFRFSFEQTFSRFERHDRLGSTGLNAVGGDPDTLVDTSNLRNERQNVPTTRLVLSSDAGDRVEAIGTAVWTPSRLRSTGPVTTVFGIDGGSAGRLAFIDDVSSSASRDVVAGNARVAIRLAPRWFVRFTGDYRDSSTDSTLLGTRLIRMTNPQGAETELATALGLGARRSVFDFTDAAGRIEIERRGDHLVLRAGAIGSQRDVANVHRRSSGATAGLSFRNARWSGAADYEHGTFEKFIFRTDAEKVDRLRLRGGMSIGTAFRVQADGRFERGENPVSVAALNHRSNFGSLDLIWVPAGRDASAGLTASSTQLHTRTDLVLPGNVAGRSTYDLDLLALTAHGRYAIGRYAFAGAMTRTRDHGSTWPVRAWNANARATVRANKRFDYGLFADYWSYDERLASVDDFNATRYGVLLVWRFE